MEVLIQVTATMFAATVTLQINSQKQYTFYILNQAIILYVNIFLLSCEHILKEEHIDGPKRLEYWVVLSSNKNKDIKFLHACQF